MSATTESGPSTNIRKHERIPAKIPIFLVVKAESKRTDHEAVTLNLSQLGVRVQGDVRLAPGQLVEIISKVSPRYAHACRVVWSGDIGSTYEGELGLQVLDPPTRLA